MPPKFINEINGIGFLTGLLLSVRADTRRAGI
jgi:hypothetical protein